MPVGIVYAAVIVIIILGILVIAELFVITALLLAMKNLVEETRERLGPIISKTNTLLITVNQLAETVQGKTEKIAEHAEHTSDVINTGMQRTSGLVQKVIEAPVIQGISLVAGIRQGLSTWRNLRKQRQEPPAAPPPAS